MKKKLLSLALALCMMVTMFAVPNTAAPTAEAATASEKDIMEEYIRTLDYGGHAPFSEYNDFVLEKLATVDVEEYENKFLLDKFGWDMIWKATQEALGNKAYVQEYYELLFADYLAKTGEIVKSSDAQKQEIVEFAKDMLKNGKNIEDITSEMTENGVQVKAYLALENGWRDFVYTVTGIDLTGKHSVTTNPNSIIKKENIYDATLLSDALEVYCVLFADYTIVSQHLDLLKESVYQAASQKSDASVAVAMKKAVDKVCRSHEKGSSAAYETLKKQLNERIQSEILRQGKAVLTKSLSEIGLGAVATKFLAGVDIALFVKDLVLESTGISQEVDAITKLTLSFNLTYMLQCKFVENGQKYMSDDVLSDEEYEKMCELFDICKAFQSLNYQYARNLHIDASWYVNTIQGKGNKYNFAPDNTATNALLNYYIKRANGLREINENVNNIDGEFEGHSYKFITYEMDITEAERWCKSVGGHVAVINSKEEWDYVENIIDTNDYRDNKFYVQTIDSDAYVSGGYLPYIGDHILIYTRQNSYSCYDISRYVESGDYKRFDNSLGKETFFYGGGDSFSTTYNDCDGYFFICEWDSYNPSKQTVKKKIKGQVGDNVYWDVEKGVVTFSGSGPMWESILTDEDFTRKYWSGENTVVIPDDVYYECAKAKKIVVSEGITSLHNMIFSKKGGNTQITEITLPESLISIGYGSFANWTNLKKITVSKNLKYIGNLAFSNCSSLESIAIPQNAKIGSTAFYGCTNLKISNIPGASPEVSPSNPETPTPDYSNNPGGFSDVRTGDKFADAVVNMVNKGVINGYPDKSFRPNGTLTRAEAAAIICRLNGNFDLAMTSTKFTDVPKSNWASGYIANANALGIIDGVGNNKYNPTGTLTGEQWIKMAVCWLGLEIDATYYGGWPDGYVTVARNIGLINGVALSNHKNTITRADACVIANNASPLKGNVTPTAGYKPLTVINAQPSNNNGGPGSHGVNNKNEAIDWGLFIELTDSRAVENVVCSWDKDASCITKLVHTDDYYSDYGWASVKNGNTHWRTVETYNSKHYLFVSFPEKQSIEGHQYIIVNGTKISFDLKWLGGYSTGNGWEITNIKVE